MVRNLPSLSRPSSYDIHGAPHFPHVPCGLRDIVTGLGQWVNLWIRFRIIVGARVLLPQNKCCRRGRQYDPYKPTRISPGSSAALPEREQEGEDGRSG
jgi:hypothetical protein